MAQKSPGSGAPAREVLEVRTVSHMTKHRSIATGMVDGQLMARGRSDVARARRAATRRGLSEQPAGRAANGPRHAARNAPSAPGLWPLPPDNGSRDGGSAMLD